MKQLSLLPFDSSTKGDKRFGGSLLRPGRRKTSRPLSTQHSIHLIFKAKDRILLFQHRETIEAQSKKLCDRFGIQFYGIAVHGDHIHTLVRIHDRSLYRKWIRALTGTLARKIPNLEWKFRPYTRWVNWGSDFQNVKDYLEHNRKEAEFLRQVYVRFEEWNSIHRARANFVRIGDEGNSRL